MATVASKGYKGVGMNGFFATWYAKITQKNMATYHRSAKQVAEMVAEGATILELAAGPGYLAIELAKLGNYHIIGLDISAKCVEIAQEKAKEADVETGQSHLINPIQNAAEIVIVPTSLETLGMNANPRRFFLTEQIEANMT